MQIAEKAGEEWIAKDDACLRERFLRWADKANLASIYVLKPTKPTLGAYEADISFEEWERDILNR